MYQKLNFTIEGVTPTIMHNGRGASVLNPIVKEIKKVSSKRNKTDEDHALMAQLEWLCGLYTTEDFDFEVNHGITVMGGGLPCWPGENIKAGLIEAAKVNKLGKMFKAAILVIGSYPIIYDGPKTIAGLFNDKRFWDQRLVVVQRSRVMRTRPIFHKWSLNFDVQYLPSLVNKEQIVEAVEIMGIRVGLSENRPEYGRFNVTKVE